MTREEIPDIHGSKWALQTIPDIVEVISGNSALSKAEQRLLLEERFRRFIRKTREGWENTEGELLRNRKGEPLKTDDELRHHIYWTWIDQYALPTCLIFMIVVRTKINYMLSSQGKRLAERLRKPGFEDMLRHIVIDVDKEKWGVLDTLRKSSMDFDALRDELENKGVHAKKDERLRKFMYFMQKIELVKEKPRSFYRLDQARYERCKRLPQYRSCDDVGDLDFVTVLHKEWDREQRQSHSSFVDIDELRALVSQALKVHESCFNEKLKSIPLQVGKFQLLFSQAAFPRENVGIERNKRYYNYISIYPRRDKGAKPRFGSGNGSSQ
jgi:hypothetical protein